METMVIPELERLEADYVQEDEWPEEMFDVVSLDEMLDELLEDVGYASVLRQSFGNLASLYRELDTIAQTIAEDFVQDVDQEQRDRFNKMMSRSLGVDLNAIVGREGLEDVLVARTQENVRLIKSIPDEYLKNVERIVYEGTVRGRRAKSMIEELRELNKSTEGRARVIARDQTSKLSAVLNQKRQQNLGIEEYIWITAKDGDRVRESHRKKHGKRFRWDSPPADTGHPGDDIQCRCIAQPVIPG